MFACGNPGVVCVLQTIWLQRAQSITFVGGGGDGGAQGD